MTFRAKTLWLGAGALTLAVGLGATALSAQNTNPQPPAFRGRGMRGGGPGMPGPGGPLAMFLGRAAEQLGLTDVQKSQIKGIADAHKDEMQTVMKTVGDARHALLTAQVTGGQSDDQIRQLSANVAKAEANAAVFETHVIAEVMQVLNADQQAQVKQFVQSGPRGRGPR